MQTLFPFVFVELNCQLANETVMVLPPIPTGIGYKYQRVLIAYLNNCFEEVPTIPSVCHFLGCSRVTATKVFDEIEAAGLAKRTSIPSSHQGEREEMMEKFKW